MNEPKTIEVKECSACGKDHSIEFTRCDAVTIGEITYSHSGKCNEKDMDVFATFDQNKEIQLG